MVGKCQSKQDMPIPIACNTYSQEPGGMLRGCAEVRDYAVEYLDDGVAIGAVNETCFLKKGQDSVGVQRQYCGPTGQIENCQVGVFLAYISSKGHSLIERRLYLPQSWSKATKKRKKAQVSSKIRFASKGQLARQML